MATQAQYASTPRVGIAQISTANTNRDGTGTIGTVFTAGASGSRIDAIAIKATSTVTAGMVRLFVNDGTNTRLLVELPIVAVTAAATTPAYEVQLNQNTMSQLLPIILPTGHNIGASTNNAETFNVFGFGGDF
jgi:hypothetical protein